MHSAEAIQQLAEDLAIAIATRGTVSSESVHDAAKNVKTAECRTKSSKLRGGANVIQSTQKSEGKAKASQTMSRSQPNGHSKSRQPCAEETRTEIKAERANLDSTSEVAGRKEENELIMGSVDSKELQGNIAKESYPVQEKEQKSESTQVNEPNALDTESNTESKVFAQMDRAQIQSKSVHGERESIHLEHSQQSRVQSSENNKLEEKDSQIKEGSAMPSQMDKNECKSVEDQNSSRKEGPSSEAFDQAFSELSDPLLPVRGHALIALGRLLKEKDPKALDTSQTLLKIFEEHLTDDDTYIYLPSINGLVALANVHPDRVMPHLCKAFTSSHADPGKQRSEVRRERSVEKTLKLGEALVRATRQLGKIVLLGPFVSRTVPHWGIFPPGNNKAQILPTGNRSLGQLPTRTTTNRVKPLIRTNTYMVGSCPDMGPFYTSLFCFPSVPHYFKTCTVHVHVYVILYCISI